MSYQDTRQQAPRQAQTQQRTSLAVVGSSADPNDVNQRLFAAQRDFNLVAPATAVGQLPEGLSVALTAVEIDQESETYSVGFGKRGLAKSALDRISAGVGISWDPARSGRLDDGRDPYYCRYLVVGSYRQFDGTAVTIQGDKEMDLRPGSPQCVALEEQQRAKGKSADGQIREMRLHILSHAETKARLRAVRSLGVRTGYTTQELSKPFVVARVMFTGQTSDPELRRMFAERTADAFLGARGALYGAGPVAPSLPAPQRAPVLGMVSAPPVGAVPLGDDDRDYYEPPPAQTARPAPQQGPPPAQGGRSGQVIPGGKSRGMPVEDADDETLDYWARRVGNDIDQPEKAQYREGNQVLLDALLAEMDARKAGGERY